MGQAKTLPSGSFRFGELTPGQYVLTVDAEGCTRREIQAVVSDRAGRTRIYFGTAGVHGIVYDADGEPMPGATLRLRVKPAGTYYERQEAVQTSDAAGRFTFQGFPAGTCTLAVRSYIAGPSNFPWPEQEITLNLREDELKDVVIGSPHPLRRWSGILRAADGTKEDWYCSLCFVRRQPDTEGRELITRIDARFDDSRVFQARLPTGTWTPNLTLYSPEYRTLVLPPRTISTEDLRDIQTSEQ